MAALRAAVTPLVPASKLVRRDSGAPTAAVDQPRTSEGSACVRVPVAVSIISVLALSSRLCSPQTRRSAV